MDVHYLQEVEARNSLARANLENRKRKDNENPQGSNKLKARLPVDHHFSFYPALIGPNNLKVILTAI